MNLDIPILLGSLLAILVSVVWSRPTTVGPVIFAWTGAAVGGFAAFIRHYDRLSDRVDIVYIIPFAVSGAVNGLLPGLAVRAAYLRGSDGRRAALEAVAGAFLGAGLGLIFGWNYRRFDDNVLLVAFGFAAVGAGIGAGLPLLNMYLSNRRADTDAIVPLKEPGTESEQIER